MTAAVLRNRSFRLLWQAQVTSSFGDALTSLALLLIAQRLTGSPAAVAGTAIAIALPQLLVGVLAGVMVDRWDRRRVMIASDLIRAALVLCFLAVSSADQLWLLYLVAFAQAAVGTFFNPARATLLAEVLPSDQLLPANSLSDTSRVVAGVAGVAVAGALASTSSSLGLVFVVDALTFGVSAALVSLIRSPVAARTTALPRRRILDDLATGLRAIRRSRVLVGVVTAGSVAMFGLGAANVLLVPFVVGEIGLSEIWFGALEAAQVVAMVMAGSLVAVFSARLRPTALVTIGAVGLGLSVAGLAAGTAPWHLMVFLFAAGWCITPLQASVTTLMQAHVPPELRARTLATLATLVSAANLASMSLAGVLAAASGIRAVLVMAGLVVVMAGVAAYALFRNATSVGTPAEAS